LARRQARSVTHIESWRAYDSVPNWLYSWISGGRRQPGGDV
jgi:hypothetical protein